MGLWSKIRKGVSHIADKVRQGWHVTEKYVRPAWHIAHNIAGGLASVGVPFAGAVNTAMNSAEHMYHNVKRGVSRFSKAGIAQKISMGYQVGKKIRARFPQVQQGVKTIRSHAILRNLFKNKNIIRRTPTARRHRTVMGIIPKTHLIQPGGRKRKKYYGAHPMEKRRKIMSDSSFPKPPGWMGAGVRKPGTISRRILPYGRHGQPRIGQPIRKKVFGYPRTRRKKRRKADIPRLR